MAVRRPRRFVLVVLPEALALLSEGRVVVLQLALMAGDGEDGRQLAVDVDALIV